MELTPNAGAQAVRCAGPGKRVVEVECLMYVDNELQMNGNGRQVTWSPPQGELQKRNTIRVFITATGNGR